jgi:hypothetical protein
MEPSPHFSLQISVEHENPSSGRKLQFYISLFSDLVSFEGRVQAVPAARGWWVQDGGVNRLSTINMSRRRREWIRRTPPELCARKYETAACTRAQRLVNYAFCKTGLEFSIQGTPQLAEFRYGRPGGIAVVRDFNAIFWGVSIVTARKIPCKTECED